MRSTPRVAAALAMLLLAAVGDSFNPPSRQWSARAAIAAIDAYRATVSPVLSRTGLIRCRFRPSCSAYGREALDRFGFFRGAALAAFRVLRCNPFSHGGDDPVPPLRNRAPARAHSGPSRSRSS